MLKIGHYQIGFGGTFFVQTKVSMTVRRFLGFWILKEVSPEDVDRKPQFPLGTKAEMKGRVFHYYKAAKDIKKNGSV